MSYASHPAQLPLYRQDDLTLGQFAVSYPPVADYSQSNRFPDSAAEEPRTSSRPSLASQVNPRRLISRQGDEANLRPLNPHLLSSHYQVYQSSRSFMNVPAYQWPHDQQPPHNWHPHHQSVPLSLKPNQGQPPCVTFPSPSPVPSARLSPPPVHNQQFPIKRGNFVNGICNRQVISDCTDPIIGLPRPPEHPRLRTAQACEKCRTRKAKCSGEHPSCKRCMTRGLVCEYAKEGRVRGPNKPRTKTTSPSLNKASIYTDNDRNDHSGRPISRARTTSVNSSTGSSGYADFSTTVRRGLTAISDFTVPPIVGNVHELPRQNSSSVDVQPSPHSGHCDLLESVSTLFRHSNSDSSTCSSTVDSACLFIPEEETQSVCFNYRGNREVISHYDMQGNPLQMQSHCCDGFPPESPTCLTRRSTTPQAPARKGHPSVRMLQSQLMPIDFRHNDTGNRQEYMFPQSRCLENLPGFHQDNIGSRFNEYLSFVTLPYIPTEVSSCRSSLSMTNSISPATYGTTASRQCIVPINSQQPEGKFNRTDLHFEVDAALTPSSHHPTPERAQEDHSSF